MIKFKCSKCSHEISFEVFRVNSFCPNCGGHIQEVYLPNPPSGTEAGGRKRLTPRKSRLPNYGPFIFTAKLKLVLDLLFPLLLNGQSGESKYILSTGKGFHRIIFKCQI